MKNHIIAWGNTTGWLLWRDLSVLRKNILNSFIDSLIMPLTMIIIGGYILPSLGLPLTYGGIMVVGSVVAMCYASTNFGGAGPLVADLQSDRAITYDITLPIPSWLVFAKTAIGFALYSIIMNSLTLFVGKLVLMDRFDISNLSVPKFILIYISSNLLFGFYCLTIAFFVKNSFEFGRFWVRIGNVLYFFSGLQFSWLALYKTLPIIACINLLNPLVYAVEGTRAAVLGQEGNLNYWLCLAAVWAWTVLFSIIGYKLFKKRLDCV